MITTNQVIAGTGTLSLLIIALAMGAGVIGQSGYYACQDTEIVMPCGEGLSGINADGIQTQCKFFSEELNRSTYKKCSSGWLEYVPEVKIKQNISAGNDTICKLKKGNGLVKECLTSDNETFLYVVGFK